MKAVLASILLGLGLTTAALGDSEMAKNGNAWEHQTERSEINNTTSEYWYLSSASPVANSIGREELAQILILCRNHETRLLFDMQNYMGTDRLRMSCKIDSGKTEKSTVSPSADGRVFGFWNGSGIALLRRLAKAKRLVIAAAPYDKGDYETAFDLAGIEQVVASVSTACGWKP